MLEEHGNSFSKEKSLIDEKLRMAIDHLAEGFVICTPVRDSSGKITDFAYLYVNNALARMAKMKKEDFPGRYLSEIIPGFLDGRLFQICKESIDAGEPKTINAEYFKEEVLGNEVEGYFDITVTSASHDEITITLQEVTETILKENRLKESEEHLRTLFESMAEGFMVAEALYDENGVPFDFIYREVNSAFSAMVGTGKENIVGKRFTEVFEEPVQKWLDLFREVVTTGIPYSTEYYLEPKNKHLEFYAFRPSMGHFALLISDRTEKKQAELALKEVHERLKFHVEYSPMGYVEFDGQFRIVAWSENSEKIFGWKREEVIGKAYNEFKWIYEEDLESVARLVIQMLSSEKKSNLQSNRNYRKDGSVIHCEWYNSALLNDEGKLISVQASVLDVTEKKLAESRLTQALDALQRSNTELEHFAHIASHDLQEPLRAVVQYLDLLKNKYKDKLDPKAHEYIGFAYDGARRMRQLISDLLGYSKVSTNKKLRSRVNIIDTIKEVSDDLEVTIKETGAEIIYGELPAVEADPVQMRQLFQNLIVNAIKFRSEKPPLITISAERYSSSQWLFIVADNGIGMESSQLERIFTIFQRLHSSDEYPGTGIGLAVCRKIVERHGGRIWAKSEINKGSAFYFTLPTKSLFGN